MAMDTVLGGEGGPGLEVAPCGVLLDLGISSPQFDDAHRYVVVDAIVHRGPWLPNTPLLVACICVRHRGFRPEQDGPLDLRFDQTEGPTGACPYNRHARNNM